MAAIETFNENRNFLSKSLTGFAKLASKNGWRAWEVGVGQACAAVSLEHLLSEAKLPAITVLDTDASVATFRELQEVYLCREVFRIEDS